jgi:hypothetical protein
MPGKRVFGGRLRESSPPAHEPPHTTTTEYLLRAYELAQRHYDSDLQLFSARMNLFLLVQSALVTVTGGSILGGGGKPADYLGAISVFGLVLAVAWLFVAVSSYAWVKTWRAHMMTIGVRLEQETSVPFSSGLFNRQVRKSMYPKDAFWSLIEAFSWAIRPTLVTCCLPLLFIGGWIYLGNHAGWSGI